MNTDLPTDPERWRQIEALFERALDLLPEERSAFLDQACAEDPQLRKQVEALLAADESAGGFLGTPAGEYAADLLSDDAAEEEGEPDLQGRLLGPYRLIRQIGSGGMGVIYAAEDTRLGRRVAVKLLPPEYGRDPRAKERFVREARTASALDHPNLCTVYDVGDSDGRLFIVLAFYEGETLRERLRRGPLPAAEARDVAVQVARGLARAHEAGITHRDIKPANVMLTRRGEAKILDFGIAKLAGDVTLTRTGGAWGTPAYMSPEQARGQAVDSRSDVWALGVLLYEMLAGQRPFEGDDAQVVLSSILAQEPVPLARLRPEVPLDLARVVATALAKEPAHRYASAAELLADLESGTAPAALPARHRWQVLQPSKALPAALLAVAVVAVALLAFARGWLPPQFAAGPALRVAVLRPAMSSAGDDPELAFVASEVTEAAVATLLSLDGLRPLDPPRHGEESGSEGERRRSSEADEVLLPLLDCRDDWCRVTFRRLRKPGGEVLATVGPFEAQAGIENALRLVGGVRAHLRQLYPEHRLRSAAPGGQVRPQDHAAYVELARRIDRGERLGQDELDRLDALLRTSPDLLGAYGLAADVARLAGDLDRAYDYAQRAHQRAPHDPAPLFTRFRVEMAAGRLEEARATLARLSEVAPGDARVQSSEADLLEARGELAQALHLRQEVARRRPNWPQILELATLEYRVGASDSARRRLQGLLKARPQSQYLKEALAALEARYGDLKLAAGLYEGLIAAAPARRYWTNLGFVRFLLADYAAAEAADRRALALEPGHVLTRVNLGAALEARGDRAAARRLFRTLEEELAASSTPADAGTRLLHAQCLARLGEHAEAARLAEEVLQKAPEDVQSLHQAAQLYALVGERLSALYYAERALKKGLRREWFTIPEFRALEEDPDFRALLEASRPRPRRQS
jgi:serine/threonine-protein kinase